MPPDDGWSLLNGSLGGIYFDQFQRQYDKCNVLLVAQANPQNTSEKYRFDRFFTARAFGSCGKLV
jgi:hypothetical protein